MISDAMQGALNAQITREFHASYLYLSIRAYFESLDLSGFANWMQLQADEERAHAMRLYDYVLDRGGAIQLGAIDAPPASFDSVLHAFESALAHEQKVSAHINTLYQQARAEGDNPTEVMLQWFVTEQVEEEANTGRIVSRLKLVGDNPTGLLLLDSELGQRQPEADEA